MSGDYRILVTGSRSWTDRDALEWQLGVAVREAELQGRGVVIVHGACPEGADAMADEVAIANGWKVERHRANWRKHGRGAGFRRNEEMIATCPDLVLAFLMPCTRQACARRSPHPTHGGGHCARRAAEAGIPVREFGGG